MAISKKEMMQSRRGLLQLRGMLAEKRAKLGKQVAQLKRIARTQEAPDWVDEVRREFSRGFDPEKPYRFYRVLYILRKNKIL